MSTKINKLSDHPNLPTKLTRHLLREVYKMDVEKVKDVLNNLEPNSKFIMLIQYTIPMEIHKFLRKHEIYYLGLPVPLNFFPWEIDEGKSLRWSYCLLYEDRSIEKFQFDLHPEKVRHVDQMIKNYDQN